MFTLTDFRLANLNQSDKESSTFLNYFTRRWNEIHEEDDVFRFKIDNLREKSVGKYLLQLNPDRNNKRRQPETIDNVLQPFDKDKFNFSKASPKEVICTFKCDDLDPDVHSILVNVSPISRYHSLLCPFINKCLPQVVTRESLEMAVNIMFCAGDRSFRVGFNSLCGFASVNHLHYHFFVQNNVLPVETVKCDHFHGLMYCISEEYPIKSFCFEIASEDVASGILDEIYKLLEYFLEHSIAHNIFMTRGDSMSRSGEVLRILVWPRKSSVGRKPLKAFNVAVLEMIGWFPVYDKEEYETLQPSDLESELNKWNVEDFENLCTEIKKLY